MARELPTYRDELEEILRFFDNKRVLTKEDVKRYTGRGDKWVASHLPKQKEYSAVGLAHALASLK